MRRSMAVRLGLGLIIAGIGFGQAVATSKYLQQLGPGDFAYDLVTEMERRGCTMRETEMASFLRTRGAHVGDVQTTILNLARAGDLRWDRRDRYTLTGWGNCR